MLVLVLSNLKKRGCSILQSATLVGICFACMAPSTGVAQTEQGPQAGSMTGHSAAGGYEGSFTQSVLVSSDANPAAATSGANGVASIVSDGEASGFRNSNANHPGTVNATFTARPSTPVFSSAPSPPQDILSMAAPPGEDKHNPPVVNELRSPGIPSDNFNDGTQAIGTLATNNPARQDQEIPNRPAPSGFGGQNTNTFQQPGFNAKAGGGFQAPGAYPPIQQPIQSTRQQSRQAPSLSVNSPPTDRPSAWRDAPPIDQTPRVSAVTDSSSTQHSFGSANSSLGGFQSKRGVRASGAGASAGGTANFGALQPNRPRQGDSVARASGVNLDHQVQPTVFAQPLRQTANSTELAKTMMERFSIDNFPNGIPGEPVKLIDMLRQPLSSQQKQPMVHQYWETYYDWTSLVAAKQYQQWLSQIPSSVSPTDKSILNAARVAAENSVLASEIQLGKSQSRLVQFMPNRTSTLLPLPNDAPLIQKYNTNYELYKAHRRMPTSLLGIDQMLPKTLELIGRRANAVRASKTAADQAVAALSSRQSTMATALEAGRIWRAAERDLVASVTSYNQAIADYSLSVSTGYQTPEQVVAMLIAKPKTNVANISQAGQNSTASERFSVVSGGQQPGFNNRRQNSPPTRQANNSQGSFGRQQQPRSPSQSGFNLGGRPRQPAQGGSRPPSNAQGGSASRSFAAPGTSQASSNGFPPTNNNNGFGVQGGPQQTGQGSARADQSGFGQGFGQGF